MSQEEVEEAVPDVLRAYTHDLRHFAALLRGVNMNNRATMNLTTNGFTVAVEEARTLLATAYVFSSIFDEYTYTAPPDSRPTTPNADEPTFGPQAQSTTFELPLNALVDCLNIFGTASVAATSNASLKRTRAEEAEVGGGGGGGRGRGGGKRGGDTDDEGQSKIHQYFGGEKGTTGLRMRYVGPGYPLTLSIAEDANGPTASCEITTFDPEPSLELPYSNENTVLRVIMKSIWLRDALSEMDPSSDKLTFIGTPLQETEGEQRGQARRRGSRPCALRLRTKGSYGSSEIEYPDDREVLETFECEQPVSFSYRFNFMTRLLKALNSSTKTSLRIDDEGLLSLQFLMPSPRAKGALDPAQNSGTEAFIEFRCLPLDEDI